MGSSQSKTVKKPNKNVPLKSVLKKPAVIGPVNKHNYYPGSYVPKEHVHPTYPTASNGNYPQNQLYPPSQVKNTIPEQQISSHQHYHTPYGHGHHRHHHHRHHHHHHQPQPPSEKERLNPPLFEERATSPGPPPFPPLVPTQKPVSSVVTYKVVSPIANKAFITPPPPSVHRSSSVHHSPSTIVKKSLTPVLIEKSPSPVVIKQYQTPQPIISKSIPSLLVPSNSFEKAPPIGINYVAKSPDTYSIHNYGSGPLTVVRRSSSRYTTSGNRWYDHDYDKRVKSFTVSDI